MDSDSGSCCSSNRATACLTRRRVPSGALKEILSLAANFLGRPISFLSVVWSVSWFQLRVEAKPGAIERWRAPVLLRRLLPATEPGALAAAGQKELAARRELRRAEVQLPGCGSSRKLTPSGGLPHGLAEALYRLSLDLGRVRIPAKPEGHGDIIRLGARALKVAWRAREDDNPRPDAPAQFLQGGFLRRFLCGWFLLKKNHAAQFTNFCIARKVTKMPCTSCCLL